MGPPRAGWSKLVYKISPDEFFLSNSPGEVWHIKFPPMKFSYPATKREVKPVKFTP